MHEGTQQKLENIALWEKSILEQVDQLEDQLIDFTQQLIRIPTINPPGENYRECSELVGCQLRDFGHQVEFLPAEGRPEHSSRHPRINVIGRLEGERERPCLHLNGHLDVVPPATGWTHDPFSGLLKDGRIYGRGSADMKAGLAAAIFATEAVRRSGAPRGGSVEISGSCDEESGGFAGVHWLIDQGRLSHRNTDFVIIPEPLGVDRICVGHRGVYWFEVSAQGRHGHGCMPFLGANAVREMSRFLDLLRTELEPSLAQRFTAMPVVPEAARRPSINVNALWGGQVRQEVQTPCVPDRCRAILDRRFVMEETPEQVRKELLELLERCAEESESIEFSLTDRMFFPPVQTPVDSTLVRTMADSIRRVRGCNPELVASPGTYDHKHFTLSGRIQQCVAYGPGRLELAHQPDEWCSLDDLLESTRVLALTIASLVNLDPAAAQRGGVQ